MSVSVPLGPEPVCLAMVLCDSISQDETGKLNLHGLFDVISPASLPQTIEVSIYLALTDARGEKRIDLRIAAAEQLLTSEIPGPPNEEGPHVLAVFSDPLEVVELTPRLPIRISEFGAFVIQLFSNGTFLQERRLHVIPPSDL